MITTSMQDDKDKMKHTIEDGIKENQEKGRSNEMVCLYEERRARTATRMILGKKKRMERKKSTTMKMTTCLINLVSSSTTCSSRLLRCSTETSLV